MKFFCDRCKTRYAIADERVRGKILKIRCKNCSAVITVREGMDDGSAEAVRHAAPTTAPPPAMPASTPPAALDEEWYVSKDGNQEGPFTLTEAQAWIGARPGDDDLFCWNEGFDDWLPVEKVSHFRGLRGATGRASTRSEQTAEPEPQPLFSATLAAIEAEAVAAARSSKSTSADSTAGPAPTGPAATGPAPTMPAKPGTGPLPTVGPLTTAKPTTGPLPTLSPAATGGAAAIAELPRPRTPSASPWKVPEAGAVSATGLPAVTATPPVMPPPVVPAPVAPPVMAAPGAPTPVAPPPRPALPTPFAGRTNGSTVAPAAAAPPVAAPAPLPTPAAAAPPVASRSTAAKFDHGAAIDDAPELEDDDDAHGPTASSPDLDDDDLDIGEVSRVVRLADLMAPPPAAAPAAKLRAQTAAMPVIGRAAMPVVGRGTGAVAAMPGGGMGGAMGAAGVAPAGGPLANQEFSEQIPVMPVEPRKRRTGLYVGIGLGATALIVIAALALSSNNEEVSGNSTSGGSNDFSGLGYRPTDPQPGTGGQAPDPGTGTAKIPGGGTGTGRRPTGGTGTPGPGTSATPGGGTGSGTGKVENGGTNPSLGELTPDDVINMSRRMETGTRRCYERAMKQDPFLKVSKIRATINVAAAGGVSDVKLSDKADHPLGVCLIAAIKRWPFGPSKEGIVSEVSLVFEQK